MQFRTFISYAMLFSAFSVLGCANLPSSPIVSAILNKYCPAELVLLKLAPAFLTVGETFTFTLSVENVSCITAQNVFITDPLPPQWTFVSATSTQGSVSFSGSTLTALIGSLPSASVATVTVTAIAASVTSTSNTATASSSNAPTVISNTTITTSAL